MSNLMDRLLKAGSKSVCISALDESPFFMDKDLIVTQIPALNIALSGSPNGGLEPGLTVLAGPSKHFKTCLGLILVSTYMRQYPEAVCMLVDSEFGITPQYMQSFGIDTSKVLHVPVEHIEQMKFDVTKRLSELKRGDKVIMLIDSIGNLASVKELEDALEEKSAADMTRAKQLKSFFRIITPQLVSKDISCIAVNHTYQTMEMFSKTVMGGGTGPMYSANTVIILGKQQEKGSEGEIEGWNFVMNIEKSRKVKEKAKIPLRVTYDSGVDRASGLQEISTHLGWMTSPTKGWYQLVDKTTGELIGSKMRAKDLTIEVFQPILDNPQFVKEVEKMYMTSTVTMITDEDDE